MNWDLILKFKMIKWLENNGKLNESNLPVTRSRPFNCRHFNQRSGLSHENHFEKFLDTTLSPRKKPSDSKSLTSLSPHLLFSLFAVTSNLWNKLRRTENEQGTGTLYRYRQESQRSIHRWSAILPYFHTRLLIFPSK